MCVCVSVCIYIYIYYMYIYVLHVYICIFIYIYTHTHIFTYVNKNTYTSCAKDVATDVIRTRIKQCHKSSFAKVTCVVMHTRVHLNQIATESITHVHHKNPILLYSTRIYLLLYSPDGFSPSVNHVLAKIQNAQRRI